MNANSRLVDYRSYLLNRGTVAKHITYYIEYCLSTEDEAAPYTFHKILVHSWSGCEKDLFETLTEYGTTTFIPVNYVNQNEIASFYTSNLTLVLKIIKNDFLFPHRKRMHNIEIVFNDKTAMNCFNSHSSIEDIVAGVVSHRLNDKFELDLSYFCNDPEFAQKKLSFYKLSLLACFKLLMIRMGRDAKILNLSNNNLSQLPIEILNFFTRGNLIALDLSNNDIQSISILQRVTSKIEKLWLEGNPLCENLDPMQYVKETLSKFPRLLELDGIRLNEHGFPLPFIRNYLVTPDKPTKMLVENFLSTYFENYDFPHRKMENFYDHDATLSISADFTAKEAPYSNRNVSLARNLLDKKARTENKVYKSRQWVCATLTMLYRSYHDPTTFTVDVLRHDDKSVVIVVDGTFKVKAIGKSPERFYQFRRTFVIISKIEKYPITNYYIKNEMFHMSLATEELKNNCFKNFKKTSFDPKLSVTLINPDLEDITNLCSVYSHLTKLKRSEAESHLRLNDWDIRRALEHFLNDLKQNKITGQRLNEDDDFSDSSSLAND